MSGKLKEFGASLIATTNLQIVADEPFSYQISIISFSDHEDGEHDHYSEHHPCHW